MLKRYLPLLFVLLVAVATALVYLVFRGDAPDAPAPPGPGRAAAPAVAPDGVREFRVESEGEYELALEFLDTSTDEIEAWARSRGFPPATYTSSPGQPLAQNYRNAREARLRELAEHGDRWAMQFLAARISPDAPREAIAWYRKAVVHGSAYAAFKLGNLYHDVARWIAINQDDRQEVIEIAERDDPLAFTSLAWLLIAEYEAGLPPGAISATLAGFHTPDEAITSSCERAAELLAEIEAERAALDILVSSHKPPLAVELPPEETVGYCPPDLFPRADFTGCETIRLVGDAGAVLGYRCR